MSTSATPSAPLTTWRWGNRIGAPDIRPSSFRKAMIEPVKVTAPIASPSDISTMLPGGVGPAALVPNAPGVDGAAVFDAEGLGRIKRSGGDQHRGQADQRMEHRHQLRHRRHLHGASAPCADAAADGDAEDDEKPGECA